MLSYENKTIKWKKRGIIVLSLFLLLAVGTLTWMMNQDTAAEPTMADDQEVILPLPDAEKEEKTIKPFTVGAVVAVDYFDGENKEADTFTKFEDVYRSSQGIDYTYNGEAFAVTAMLSGKIADVRDDELFGKTVVLQSGELSVTMQSLGDVKVKKGDQVKQGDTIANAGTCVYSKDLGNHLHLVTEVKGQLVNPNDVYEKSAQELMALVETDG